MSGVHTPHLHRTPVRCRALLFVVPSGLGAPAAFRTDRSLPQVPVVSSRLSQAYEGVLSHSQQQLLSRA
eukprot:364964-Chlamydomonas_euryale.AAC.20